MESRTKVRVGGNSIVLELPGGAQTLPLRALPDASMDWIDRGRRRMYGQLCGRSSSVRFFSQHLPVLVTSMPAGAPFPFNCCNKGVGFIPKERYLEECVERFRATLEQTRDKPWQESLKQRLKTASDFYFAREKIDPRAISSLEIFEGRTLRNLARSPFASLLFTGDSPDYTSFQLNCAVELVGEGDPRHTFIQLARSLFEHDSFHIAQPPIRYAYLFWICEVLDKTPVRVKRRGPDQTTGKLSWQPGALGAIARAPGMIRQHIREQVEKYALAKGCTEVSSELVREAKRALTSPGHASSDYRRIYVCLDGSDLSTAAMEMALAIGSRQGAELVGSHVYAAELHDRRFRSMESGLPREYQVESALEKQRAIHDSLITKGLELISDSYLAGMRERCREQGVAFAGVSLEGRNWQELANDISGHEDYDLIALGGHGVGRVAGALLGTVVERLLRRVKRDILICKRSPDEDPRDRIVVCLDGSERSWGALQRGIQLAKAFGRKLVAISAFDPYFHYTMFATLNQALTDEARAVFRFEQQEQLHEEIIDTGLAKIYQSHLDIARRICADADVELETKLLGGKAYEKILEFVRDDPPWLLILGRTGIHSDEELDIGGQTENICRLALCNLLVTELKSRPPERYQAAETITWSAEARSRMERVPAMARGVAMNAVQNHCMAEGHTVVTTSVLLAAMRQLLPPEAIERMGMRPEQSDTEAEEAPGERGRDLCFGCAGCGHVHHGLRPAKCPVCGQAGNTFELLEDRTVADPVASVSMDGRELTWAREVLQRLEQTEPVLRRQLRAKLEKQALARRLATITVEMLERCLPPGARPPRTGSFECPMCGYVLDGGGPKSCPACGVGALRAMSGVERERVPAAAAALLEWDRDALERMERIPVGFMRTMTRCRVEQWARRSGRGRVTLEAVEAKYSGWSAGSSGIERRLEWSDEALARLGKVPEFIRPLVARELERSAEQAGHDRVDSTWMDDALRQWDSSGAFHGD